MEALQSRTTLYDEDKALKSLLDTFGSVFSLEDIASAFCKAGRDTNLAGELLCELRTSPSADTAPQSNGFVRTESLLNSSDDNGNGDFKALRSKRNSVSMGTVSSVIGKNYVWRPKANVAPGPNGPKRMAEGPNKLPGPANSSEAPVRGRKNDANLSTDFESFLFEMLGQGFQLERSTIGEVLGHCGYDMKKSVETLLDLTAVTLDRRNNLHEDNNLISNSEILSSQNQEQKHKAESGTRTVRANGTLSRQSKERYEQQKEVLTALFHVPERHDLTVTAPAWKPVRRSRGFGTVVTGPLKDIDDNHKANDASSLAVDEEVTDEAGEDSFQILRKAVKEYRYTMKEYYKAAAEAFANGDRVRADTLLEKGQFFYNKAREADEESARKIFETNNQVEEVQSEMCLDLQHHDVKEAIRLVKCHLCSLAGIPSIKNLKIIIGIDNRDAERRKRLVLKLLEREAIEWIEQEDLGTVLIRLDEINPKRLSFATN